MDKLVEIVSDDDLNVTMEEFVYEACMAWLEEDVESRKSSLVEVRQGQHNLLFCFKPPK